jgi:hypothetical protein
MRKLKKSLTYSSLILLLTVEVFAYNVFSLAWNRQVIEITRTSSFPESKVLERNPVYQKGMSFSAWSSDAFDTPESDESLALLTKTNTEWVAINFAWSQSNTTSHDIKIDPTRTPTTTSIEHAITTAHSLGFKVMLKPMVDTLEEEQTQGYPTVWRGQIQPSEEWFESYSNFINFFANFAEQNYVELFSVGCELKETTGEKEQWETVIAGVRERYSGPIVYSADWTNYKNIKWWDSVDYVGIDAYFWLSFKNDPSLDELKSSWTNYADEIEAWLPSVNKPVIFTEIGYRSGDGTNRIPSNFWSDMTLDLQEQEDCYEAAFQVLWNRSWFYGFYWWTWTHNPDEGGSNDSNHTPQNKPAQEVVTNWYSLNRQIAVVDQSFTSDNKSILTEVRLVGFHVSWEHDSTDVVDAIVYVNGTAHGTNSTGWVSFNIAYNTVGKRLWVVTDFEHPQATSYKTTIEWPAIVWDSVIFDVEIDSSTLGVSKVKVKIVYAYNGTSVTGATTTVNGEICEETKPGIYETKIDSWSPYQQMTIKTDHPDFARETWTTSTLHVMNLILYIALVVAVIVVVFVLFKLLKRSSA